MKQLLIILALVTGTAAGAQQRPNIIYILADDLGYGDIGCYGQEKIKTPNIDQLAKAGMKFTDFYAGSTVCAPSRASLMTGLHTGHSYVRGNGEIALREKDSVLTQYLQQQGYTTGMVGKWGLGLEGTPGVPEKKGWDFFVGHLHHVEGHFQHGDSLWMLKNGVTGKREVGNNEYYNEIFTDSALAFIRAQSAPFFLYVSYTLPHAELNLPEKYLTPYLNADGSSKFAPEKPQREGLHYRPQPYPRAAYAAMVSSMDAYVGRIVEQVKAQGLEKNTIIIFTSDNGTHIEGGRTKSDATEFFRSSGPFRGVKRDLYEGGIRVPFVIKWPAVIAPGSVNDFAGAFWDILPTFTQLAGKMKTGGDGISFVPALEGKHQPIHQFLYWEFNEGGYKRAIRAGNWKAIRFYKQGTPVKTELYDLNTDPGETTDLGGLFPNKAKELEQQMDKEYKEPEQKIFRMN